MAQSELYRRAYEELKAGHYEEAKRLFAEDEAKAGTASATRAMLRDAEKRLAAGDLNGAAPLYDELLDRNPSLPEIYFGLARISIATGKLDAAKVHATAATKLAPGAGLSWALLGLVHESEGDVKTALEHLHKAAELSAQDYLCQFNYGRVLAVAGRPQDAVGPLGKATWLEPKNADAFYALGMANKQAGQYESALRAFEKAKDLAPRDLDKWATLADVLFMVKEFKAARDILDLGLKELGDNPVLLEKALAAAMMLSDADGAVAYVERELKVVPTHEQGWLNLANLSLLTRDFEKSEKAAREALRLNPKSWEAWYHLGNLFDAVPLEDKAEEAYRKAVELSPGNWKPLANLAALLVQSKSKQKNAEAVPLLEKAASLAPAGDWRVQYNLALAHTRLGDRERALELARRILREAPPGDPMVAEAKKLESNLLEAMGHR